MSTETETPKYQLASLEKVEERLGKQEHRYPFYYTDGAAFFVYSYSGDRMIRLPRPQPAIA